jgi:hypothetical protein
MTRLTGVWCVTLALVTFSASSAFGWSGGPVYDVTDLEPKCAVCHSVVSKDTLRTEPAGVQNFFFLENRHYRAIETGAGPYQAMSPEDRQKLLTDVKVMDENASVSLTAPSSAQPGQTVQVTVTVKGGNEVVGVALVDTDLVMRARIIQAEGWQIMGPPKVRGTDGAEQTKWVDGRGQLSKNLNSAVIFDQPKADLAAKRLAGGSVTWTLKAPMQPGTYGLTAVFFYGTEKASPLGRVTTATQVNPRGGGFGAAGRVMFGKPVTVTVR